ncbi:hypothetical protein D3C76_851720 [compost metagenome]
MVGGQSQVYVEGGVALRQGQHEVAAGQWSLGLGVFVARAGLIDQLVAVQYVHVELAQVRREHAQQLFMFARCKPESQP